MDREKAISTFEKIISVCKEDGCDFVDLSFEDAEQILALLKEQEPQSVIVREEPQNGNILWFADCPKCKHGIERDKHKHFCGFCGQAVKWND